MLIEGVAHLNAKIPTRDKLALGANAHIQMLLWKPNKVHFQFEEPSIDEVFELGLDFNQLTRELRNRIIYNTKKRFEVIDKYVEKYIVFTDNIPLTFT